MLSALGDQRGALPARGISTDSWKLDFGGKFSQAKNGAGKRTVFQTKGIIARARSRGHGILS